MPDTIELSKEKEVDDFDSRFKHWVIYPKDVIAVCGANVRGKAIKNKFPPADACPICEALWKESRK